MLRRYGRVLSLLALLVAAGGGAWWLLASSPMSRLRASGAPVCYADLVADPIPDAQNAAAGIRDAIASLGPTPIEVADALEGLEGGASDALATARGILGRSAETLGTIDEAVRRPEYASLLTAERLADEQAQLDACQEVRPLARLLALQTRVAQQEGRTGDAARAVESLALLGEGWAHEPLLLSRLAAIAVQTMAVREAAALSAAGALDEPARECLEAAMSLIEDRGDLAERLAFERVVTIEKLEGMGPVANLWEKGPLLRFYEQAINNLEQGEMKSPRTGLSPLASLLAPSIDAWLEAEQRVATEARGVRQSLAD